MRTGALAITLCFAIAPLTAQRPDRGFTPPAVVTPIHTQDADPEGGAYGIWAAGEDYKVGFHAGATFVPYLGSGYPQNQPFAWTTTSVQVGEIELCTRSEPAAATVAPTRYEYDLGGVVEAYDVRLEGLEQTFVIGRRPLANGDLVIRGRIDTALTADPVVDRHGPVQFVDHNRDPILTYGAATAVDANGASRAMTTSYEAGRLELRLDGAWLRDAVFPIVVDPLMTNNVTLNTWSGSFGQHVDLDVLREDERATENVWVCYTRSVSATDQDLWLFRTQDNMAPAPLIQTFADITTSWGNGTCALAHADSRVVCAFVRVFATTRNVRWHAHHINDLALRTGVGAYLPHSGNWRVDIGGNAANTGATRAMVVYQHESAQPFANGNDSETRAFYIDFAGTTTTTGQGTGTGDRQLFGSSTADVERPRINQVADGLGANHWCVVHQFVSNTNPNDDWDVYIDIWDENGNLRSFTQTTSGNGRHELGPVVAGRGGRYLVSYGGAPVAQVGPTTTILSYEILTQRIDFNGTTISRPHPEYQHLADSTRVLETRDIAFDSNTRCHWLSLNRWGNRVYADKLGYRGQYVTFDTFMTGQGSGTSVRDAAVSFDRDHGRYVLVGSDTVTGSYPIHGNVWSDPALASPSLFGITCSSGVLSWVASGALVVPSQRIGFEYSGVRLTGVPNGALCFLGVSLTGNNMSLNGIPGVALGCTQLISTTSGFLGWLAPVVANPLGTGWNFPLPEFLPPTTLRFQCVHLDGTGTVFQTTRRLDVPIGH